MHSEDKLKRIEGLFRCPECFEGLERKDDSYICKNRHKFEIKENIPILLNERDRLRFEGILSSPEGKKMKEVYLPSLKKRLKDLFRPPKIVLNNPEVERKIKESFRCKGENTIVLNVGSGVGRMGENVINLEIGVFPDVDVVGNGENLPFIDESFDVVYSNALLEHVPEPELIIKEMYRVLKKEGVIWGFIPFLQPYHGYPYDYQRYTITGIENLFSRYFRKIETGIWSGPSSAVTWILRDYIKMLIPFSNREFFRVILNGILNLLLFPLKYLDYILLKRKDSYTLASVVYFYGKKM